MDLHFKKLGTGYVRIQGYGPENWWQGEQWPGTEESMLDGLAAEASKEFRTAVYTAWLEDVMDTDGPHRGDVI